MEYLKFYQLEREPFQNDADGFFYFEGSIHRRARLFLLRGVQQRKGLSVLVGGPGCGKTTLAQQIFDGIDEDQFAARLLLISHSECANGWLLPKVARAFGVESPPPDAPSQLEQIQAAFAEKIAGGRHPVVLVDEAQLMANASVMEEFRGLLNLTHEGRRALSILLFGLPELSDVLKLDPPLAQRIEIRADVSGLPPGEVKAYVRHRLERAGTTAEIFTDQALDALSAYSSGIPRLVNTLADNALFEGFMAEASEVDASLIAAVAEQLELAAPGAESRREAQLWTREDDPDLAAPPLPRVSPRAGDDAALDEALGASGVFGEDGPNVSSDFSMGSVVRSIEEDFEHGPEPDAAEELAVSLEPAPAAQAVPSAEAETAHEEDGDDEFEIDLEALPAEVADAEEVAPAAGDAEAAEPSDEGEDEGFHLGEALLEDDESSAGSPEFSAGAESEEASLGETFVAEPVEEDALDPGELLVDDEDESEAATAEPDATAESDAPEADLDELFESIQVND